MLAEDEALQRILARVTPLRADVAPLDEALGRFPARAVHAVLPLPGFDNSAMDGYALRSADSHSKKPLRVIARQSAGLTQDLKVEPQTAVRIFTGAPVPRGADSVIMQEDVTVLDAGDSILCNEPVAPQENVRRAGCDLCAGQRIVDAGERLTAAKLAVIASQGLREVETGGVPSVAIVTTGDELAEPGQLLQPGQIYNSNAVMLRALLRGLGIKQITTRHVPDDFARTTEALREVVASHDFVILSGGVSVGEHDFVKPALEALGIPQDFWRVRIKPGKPLLFTHAPRGGDSPPAIVFGLPGNPVSGFVTFMVFVRPALLKAMGANDAEMQPPRSLATTVSVLRNKGDRPHYLRGRIENGVFTAQGLQQSHAMFALSQSNALLRMEPDSEIAAGATVTVLMV
jgi:molybdopterin molybdotransferase